MNNSEYSGTAAAVEGTELGYTGSVPLLFARLCPIRGVHMDMFDQELTDEIHLLGELIVAVINEDWAHVEELLGPSIGASMTKAPTTE